MRTTLIADGSIDLGVGHQVRMSTLAEALVGRGHTVELLCRELPGSAHGWAWSSLNHRVLPATTPVEELMRMATGDWIVVDHYGMRGERLAGRMGGRLLLVQDLVEGPVQADLLLNQNLGVAPSDYPPGSLVGAQYALVRAAFRGRRWSAGGGVLLMCGGTDHLGLLPGLVELLAATMPGRQLHVVGGPVAPPHCVHHRSLPAADMASLMAECDLAVLAAGSTVYEALTVGIPFVGIQTADNQHAIAIGLRKIGVPVVTPESLHLLPGILADLRPPPLVLDGLGAERVVGAMERSA